MKYADALKVVQMIDALINFNKATKITSTFTSAFKENTIVDINGNTYLQGSFNSTGTVSGRLSSSDPNLMNMPNSSTYGKLIKQCFISTNDWLFVGADFASLEDRISALQTKDPNKLKVYIDGYDGHCLRAYAYFGHLMPDIDPESVKSINSIKKKYPELRQDSKIPTFALTYQGTHYTLMNNLGFSKKKAIGIEVGYHEMYAIADAWVNEKLEEASRTGYVELAFGLRLRTPIIQQTVFGAPSTPYEAKKEGRTAGNALGQSYGLLNNRAAVELQNRLFDSPYIYDIKPVAHIHDAQYFVARRDPAVITWLNDNLIECMEWQDLPDIRHDEVKLGGNLDIFCPSWAFPTEMPNKTALKDTSVILNGLNSSGAFKTEIVVKNKKTEVEEWKNFGPSNFPEPYRFDVEADAHRMLEIYHPGNTQVRVLPYAA